MGHRAVAGVAESFALELFNAGEVRASNESPAHHRVSARDNHTIIGLRVRRPSNNHRTTATDHDWGVPTACANQLFWHRDAAASCNRGGARRNKLFHVEAILFVNPCFIGSDERDFVERNISQPNAKFDELFLGACGRYGNEKQGHDESQLARPPTVLYLRKPTPFHLRLLVIRAFKSRGETGRVTNQSSRE